MESIHIPDIGHGLAAQIFHYPDRTRLPPHSPSSSMALLDCGKRHGSKIACHVGLEKNKPEIFILSHFHGDHYNGMQAAESDSQNLKKVYYPRIPDFPDRDKYLVYNIAMTERVYGRRTGSVTADLLRNIKRINCREFEFVKLYQGREISFGDQKYDVLWPPRQLVDPAQELSRALETFEKAREEDPILKEITDSIREREVVSDYRGDRREYEPVTQDQGEPINQPPLEDRELPDITQQAQKRLREATDRMSLAFHNPDRILFLGDLKAGELRKVSKRLVEMKDTHYDILISPHHGTRYSTAMADLEANWTVSSLGIENLKSIHTRIRDIGHRNWATYLDGDFSRPIYSASTILGG